MSKKKNNKTILNSIPSFNFINFEFKIFNLNYSKFKKIKNIKLFLIIKNCITI